MKYRVPIVGSGAHRDPRMPKYVELLGPVRRSVGGFTREDATVVIEVHGGAPAFLPRNAPGHGLLLLMPDVEVLGD